MIQEENKVIIPEVEKAIEEWFALHWEAYLKSQEKAEDLPF